MGAPINQEIFQKLMCDFLNGVPLKEISARYGTSYSAPTTAAARYGIPMRGKYRNTWVTPTIKDRDWLIVISRNKRQRKPVNYTRRDWMHP